MAIQWAVEKCRYYLRGISSFTVVTDHKPLVGVFEKVLHKLPNVRLRRFREHLADYSFDVKWCPGKEHCIADALSRAPVFPPAAEDCNPVLAAFSVTASCNLLSQDPAFAPILAAAQEDGDYQALLAAIAKDLPLTSPALVP